MAKRIFSSNLLDQAVSIHDAWARIDEKLIVNGETIATLANQIKALQQVESNMASLENQLTALRSERVELQQSAWTKIKGLRAAVKGIYGDDSTQYKLVGGTPLSERKPRRRTPFSES